jgi:SAM-dependent methyltransferase
MLEAAAVGPGTRLLDAGCGSGGASVLAASRGAHVNGLAAAAALLAIARERVADGDFRCGDVAALPYADETFDAIIAADVLPYVADPLAGLQELRRVCAPHGRVVLSVLSAPEDCTQYSVVTAVQQLLPGPQDGDAFALSAPGVLDALLVPAGLHVRGEGRVVCSSEYPDREIAWQALASAGPLQAAVRAVDEQRLKVAVLAALAPYRTSSGGVRIHICYRYVVAVPAEDRRAERWTQPEPQKGGRR